MSDAHGHDAGHGDGAAKESGGRKGSMSDNFINKIIDFVTENIAKAVAFIFILVTIGAVLGWEIAQRGANPLFLFVPAAIGIVAYYERDIAIILFVALILLLFI